MGARALVLIGLVALFARAIVMHKAEGPVSDVSLPLPKETNTVLKAGLWTTGKNPGHIKSKTTAPKLLSRCKACSSFIPQLLEIGEHALHPSNTHPAELRRVNTKNKELCRFVDQKFRLACVDVADTYGLENVHVFTTEAPDLLCERLHECGGEKLLETDLVKAHLQDAVLGDKINPLSGAADVLISADVSTSVENKIVGAVAGAAMGGGGGGDGGQQAEQQMLQGQKLRETEMRQMDNMLQQQIKSKMLAAEERNRTLRMQLAHVMKEAYRSMPGNCDCCEACLPPDK